MYKIKICTYIRNLFLKLQGPSQDFVMQAGASFRRAAKTGIAVYGSVWVDLYAPKDSGASWLGAMQVKIGTAFITSQASSLVGLVIGFTIAGWGTKTRPWFVLFCFILFHVLSRLLGRLGSRLLPKSRLASWPPLRSAEAVRFAATGVCMALMPTVFLGDQKPGSSRSSEPRMSFLVSTPGGSFMAEREEEPMAAHSSLRFSETRSLRRGSVEVEQNLLLHLGDVFSGTALCENAEVLNDGFVSPGCRPRKAWCCAPQV